MWLDIALALLLVAACGQSFLLLRLWRQSRQLRQHIDQLSHGAAYAVTDVPTSMLVASLGRLERQMRLIEQQAPPTRQSFELAQQLAREGVELDELASRCGLSRDEARLVMQMHPADA